MQEPISVDVIAFLTARSGSPGSYAGFRLRITPVTARQYQNIGTRLTIPSLSQISYRIHWRLTVTLKRCIEGEVTPDRTSLCVVELIDDTDDTVYSM